MSCEHFNFSHAHPPDELGNNSLACAEGDGVSHIAQVWLEPGGDVDGSQLPLEVSDFKASGDELVAELLLPGAAFIQFLTGGEGLAVYGGDESIGDGVDRLIDIRMRAQENLGCPR